MNEPYGIVRDWQWFVPSIAYFFFGVLPYYYQIKRIKLAIAKNWVIRDAADAARILIFRNIVMFILALILAGLPIIAYFQQVKFSNWYWIFVVVVVIFFSNSIWKSHLALEHLKQETSKARRYWGEE